MSTSKLQIILELKDRLTKGVNRAKGKVNSTLKGIKRKFKQFSLESSQAFKGMTDQIPGLGNALSLLSNPYVCFSDCWSRRLWTCRICVGRTPL